MFGVIRETSSKRFSLYNIFTLSLPYQTYAAMYFFHFITLYLSQIKQLVLIINATTLSNHPTGLTCDTYIKNRLTEIPRQNTVFNEIFIIAPIQK